MEQLGEIAGLLVALDRREDELDRPLGGHPLGLERVGQAQTADHQVRPVGGAAVELTFDVLALAEARFRGQQGQLFGQVLTVQEGGADLDRRHAQLARQEARDRRLKLGIGEEEDPLAGQTVAVARHGPRRPFASRPDHPLEDRLVDSEGFGGRLEP